MSTYCPPTGPRDAKIVIIGEAPGQEEEARGEPFVGGSGRLLNAMLQEAGLHRDLCYLTNVCKTRPLGNDFGHFYEDPKTRRRPTAMLLEAWRQLHEELDCLKPNVIVPVGSEPLRAITDWPQNKASIEKWRGSIFHCRHGKVVGTYHPAALLREPSKRAVSSLDWQRIREESRTPALQLPQCRFNVDPSFDAVMEYINDITPADTVSFDIETSGPYVQCLGLSTRCNCAICIPFICNPFQPSPGDTTLLSSAAGSTVGNSYWSEVEEYEVLKRLDVLFRDPTISKVAQNFPFDALVLSRDFGFRFAGLHMDTMVAHHACYCEMPKGLDFLASVYTRIPYYSDYDKNIDRSTRIYNCYDACATLEVAQKLDQQLTALGLYSFYHDHLNPAVLAATRVETRGVLVDQEVRREQATEIKTRLTALATQLRTIGKLDLDFNPNSDKQVKDFLYTKLGLKPIINRKTGSPTTDKHAIIALRRRHPHLSEIFDLLAEYSEKATLLSGFLEKPLGEDGRIRTHFNVAGTVTGRWSSSEPLFDIGTNLQNIPVRSEEGRRIRKSFIPDPGWTWMKADYRQGEFWIVVWLAKIDRLIQLRRTDPTFDPLRFVASLIYNKPPDQVTKDERQDGKNGAYGGNYGVQDYRASQIWRCPVEKARFVLTRYRQAIPEIPLWWQSVQRELHTTRTIRSPLGRYRAFLDRIDEDMFRAAYSHSAQSIVADLINRSFSILDDILDPDRARLVLQVHDEFDLMVRPDAVQQTATVVKNVMEYPLTFPDVAEPLVLSAEVSVGANWYEVKEVV